MDTFVSPVGEWEACGDAFYLREELYPLDWQDTVHLEEMRVACAPYSGPIAMIRDDRQLVTVRSAGGDMRPVLRTYNAAGVLLGTSVWEGATIAFLGWTSSHQLLVMDSQGLVAVYSPSCERMLTGFSCGGQVDEQGVARVVLWQDVLMVMTHNSVVWLIDVNFDDVRPQRMFDPGLQTPPQDIAVLPATATTSGVHEVLLAVEDTILVITNDAAHDTRLAVGSPLVKLAVAPNGQFVAAFAADGRLLVWVSDFTNPQPLSEYATGLTTPPEHLAWCSTHGVVLISGDMLILVGPFGDMLQQHVDPPCFIHPEVDGVRLIMPSSHALLQRVPDALQQVFSPGSTAPGALLLDARKLFDAHSPRADEVLRSIAGQLPDAVHTCADAALAAHDPIVQSVLLKAACYGVAFCAPGSFPSLRLAKVAHTLRVLRALRGTSVAWPLSAGQLEALGDAPMLQLLTQRRHHLLAMRIAEQLGVPRDKIVEHWACCKLASSPDLADEELCDVLVAKLSSVQGVRYAAVATKAEELGRRGLAALLLDQEQVASEQVPLLLGLHEYQRSLSKASNSGDPDLVYLVLFHLYRALPLQEFLALLSSRPYARNLFLSYCRRQEPALLEQLYMAMGLHEGVAEMKVIEALTVADVLTNHKPDTRPRPRDVVNVEVIGLLTRAAELYTQSDQHGFHAKAAADYARLRRLQGELEADTGQLGILGRSVADTVKQCLLLGNARLATKVKQEFKMSDRAFAWLRVQTLVKAKDWEGLDQLARDKKASSIPIEMLIQYAKEHHAPTPAVSRLIARIPDPRRRAEEYAAVGVFQEAAEAAAAGRDIDLLDRIQASVGAGSPLALAINQIRDRMQAGR